MHGINHINYVYNVECEIVERSGLLLWERELHLLMRALRAETGGLELEAAVVRGEGKGV